jgi:thioredoxin 1
MLELDKETFGAQVLEATGLVFVDFYSDSCEPCKALMPTVQALSEKYGDKMKFTKINTMKARRLAISQKVLGLPVTAIYKNGEKLTELVKEDCTPESIEKMIEDNI